MPVFRRTVTAVLTGLLAVSGVVASAGSASADTNITVRYPVTGSTYLKAPNFTLGLGPGALISTVDLNTGALTANLKLPNATGSFNQLGLIPVTATTQFINDGPTTGQVDLNTGSVTSTSVITLRIVDLKVAGLDIAVGNACETSTPVTVTVTSQPGFNIIKGGNLGGTYTVPPFANCGLATALINLTLPGSGNTITLTLGKAKRIG
jgi:hypothetical protein